MNILILKIKKIIKSNSGETLLEGIISIFVLTVLLAAVTMMIMTSLGMTRMLTENAEEAQESANDAILVGYSGAGTNLKITFKSTNTNDIIAEHNVVFYRSDDGTVAFSPR